MSSNIPRSTKISIVLVSIIFFVLSILIPSMGGSMWFLLLTPVFGIIVAAFLMMKPADKEGVEAIFVKDDPGSINLFPDDAIYENNNLRDMSAITYFAGSSKLGADRVVDFSYKQVDELLSIKAEFLKTLDSIRQTNALRTFIAGKNTIKDLCSRLSEFDSVGLADVTGIDMEEKRAELKDVVIKTVHRIADSTIKNYDNKIKLTVKQEAREKLAAEAIGKLTECKESLNCGEKDFDESLDKIDTLINYVKNNETMSQ